MVCTSICTVISLCLLQSFAVNAYLDLGLENLGEQISRQVQENLSGLDGLGDRIRSNVRNNLRPLQNLGPRIRSQVEESLQPVRAMEIQRRMANGVGGVAVAYYNDKAKFLIRNGIRSVCSGDISPNSPQCNGREGTFTPSGKEDICYANSYAAFDDEYCLSFSPISIQVYNGIIKCSSFYDNEITKMSRGDFQNLCGFSYPGNAVYRYYPDYHSPDSIRIPNQNPYVRCINQENGVCEFKGVNSGENSGMQLNVYSNY